MKYLRGILRSGRIAGEFAAMGKVLSSSFRQLCKLKPMERIALFAGSFDPFTVAHFSLAKRASALFDRVIIAVGENVQKHPLFSTELRVKLIQKATANLENVCVKSYAGLTGNFATENGAKFLLRGIRSPNEFDIERKLA